MFGEKLPSSYFGYRKLLSLLEDMTESLLQVGAVYVSVLVELCCVFQLCHCV